MVAATRPGGLVLVEDVEVAAIWSSPPSAALERHTEIYVAAAHGLGHVPDFACEIAPTLAALGATDIHVDVVQPVLRGTDELRAHACTMEAIAQPALAQGIATAEEIDELVSQLDELAVDAGLGLDAPPYRAGQRAGTVPLVAAQLPAVARRVLAEEDAAPVELVVAELDAGIAQSPRDRVELVAELDRGVRPSGRHVVGIEAEVHLGAVVGLVPARTEPLRLRRRLDLAVAEDPDQEVGLGVGAVGRDPQVHVV